MVSTDGINGADTFSRSDSRVLGSGDFVKAALGQAEKWLETKYLPKRPVEEIIEEVAQKLDLSPELICSGSRKKEVCRARALVAYVAVEQVGHKASEVARILRVHRVSARQSAERGREIFRKMESSPQSA